MEALDERWISAAGASCFVTVREPGAAVVAREHRSAEPALRDEHVDLPRARVHEDGSACIHDRRTSVDRGRSSTIGGSGSRIDLRVKPRIHDQLGFTRRRSEPSVALFNTRL